MDPLQAVQCILPSVAGDSGLVVVVDLQALEEIVWDGVPNVNGRVNPAEIASNVRFSLRLSPVGCDPGVTGAEDKLRDVGLSVETGWKPRMRP